MGLFVIKIKIYFHLPFSNRPLPIWIWFKR
jgi:hypothetical protein